MQAGDYTMLIVDLFLCLFMVRSLSERVRDEFRCNIISE